MPYPGPPNTTSGSGQPSKKKNLRKIKSKPKPTPSSPSGGGGSPGGPYGPSGGMPHPNDTAAGTTGVPAADFDFLGLDELAGLNDLIIGTTTTAPADEDQQFQENGPGGVTGYTTEAKTSSFALEVAILKDMASGSPDEYAEMVGLLVRSGYLSLEDARFTSYTQTIGKAYVVALKDLYDQNQASKRLNDQGYATPYLSVWELLDQQAAEVDQDGDGIPDYEAGAGTAPKQVVNRHTDEATLTASVQSQAQSLLGRRLRDDEVAEYVTVFRGLEAEFNAAANSEEAVVDVTDPNPSGQAEAFVQGNYESEIGQQFGASYVSRLQQLMGL